jgi:tRNA uridine 5-carboxymethylaminomethyl modification enzyme
MSLPADVVQGVVIDAKYEGYLEKQERLAAGLKALEKQRIPADLDVSGVRHLRAEAREKLLTFRPGTLGQAGRISGITPADITVLQIHLRRHAFSEKERRGQGQS